MLPRTVEDRALSEVTREARRAPAPELRWELLETRLLASARADARGHAQLAPPRTWLWAGMGTLAVAAFALLFLRVPETRSVETRVPPITALDGDRIAPERTLIADEHPLTVAHAGRAEWELEPRSQAAVIDHGGRIRIRLTRGALRARVVPSKDAERFIVEAGETRVAVHGTVFRVELRGDQSFVRVEEGVVAVGPRGEPKSPARFLRAPSEGRFGKDGLPVEACVVEPRAKSQPRATVSRPAPEPSLSPATAIGQHSSTDASVTELGELTIGQVETGVSAVVKGVTDCFERHTAHTGNVRISARTTVTLDIAPSGELTQVAFVPPLAPAAQACSEQEVRRVRFAASSGGARVTRVLEFAR